MVSSFNTRTVSADFCCGSTRDAFSVKQRVQHQTHATIIVVLLMPKLQRLLVVFTSYVRVTSLHSMRMRHAPRPGTGQRALRRRVHFRRGDAKRDASRGTRGQRGRSFPPIAMVTKWAWTVLTPPPPPSQKSQNTKSKKQGVFTQVGQHKNF